MQWLGTYLFDIPMRQKPIIVPILDPPTMGLSFAFICSIPVVGAYPMPGDGLWHWVCPIHPIIGSCFVQKKRCGTCVFKKHGLNSGLNVRFSVRKLTDDNYETRSAGLSWDQSPTGAGFLLPSTHVPWIFLPDPTDYPFIPRFSHHFPTILLQDLTPQLCLLVCNPI